MEMRVEQLSQRSEVPVDTIRYYQHKGLLDPPRREGRVAWYDEGHLERLARIRTLQQRGFTLATIVRLVTGDLDAADEALVGELSGLNGPPPDPPGSGPDASPVDTETAPCTFTLAELADTTGVPLALLKATEAEGLLVPRRIGGQDRYTDEDVAACLAALRLLEWGIPLSALLDLARRHHRATEAVAEEAVALFSTHVRGALRADHQAGPARPDRQDGPNGPDEQDGTDEPHVERLLLAYAELLPAVDTLVGHHFTRTLVKVALDHVERDGSEAERRAVWAQVGREATDGRDRDHDRAPVSGP